MEKEKVSNIEFSPEISSIIEEAKQYQSFLSDTTLTLFYDSGEPRLTFKRSNGMLDSILFEQYKSGLPKTKINFIKGKLGFGGYGSFYDSLIVYFFSTNEDTLRMETPMVKSYYHTNPSGNLVYYREYDSSGVPVHSEGELITYTNIVDNKDSIILQFYIVNEPYFSRYDLQRTFHFTTSDGMFENQKIPINEEYSAVFVKLSKANSKNLGIQGIAEFKDLVATSEKTSVLKDTVELSLE